MSTLTSLELILYNEVTGGHKMKEENKKTGWERQVEAKDSGEKKHPTVICDNLRLIVGLGQWLEVLPAKRKQRKYGMLTNTDLSVQEILRMKHISNGKKEMINRKFSEILSLAGIDNNETCLLSRYDEYNKSFDCYFVCANIDARIILENRNYKDEISYLTIDTKKEERKFSFLPEDEEGNVKLNLISHVIKPKKMQKDFKINTKKKIRYR